MSNVNLVPKSVNRAYTETVLGSLAKGNVANAACAATLLANMYRRELGVPYVSVQPYIDQYRAEHQN